MVAKEVNNEFMNTRSYFALRNELKRKLTIHKML